METAGSLSSQQALATSLDAEPAESISFYTLTLLDTIWYDIQLTDRAWVVVCMHRLSSKLLWTLCMNFQILKKEGIFWWGA